MRLGPKLAILAALLVASAAFAQDVPRRAIAVRFESGVARLDLSLVDVADAPLRARLESGLPQTLLTRAYAFRDRGAEPIALGMRECRVAFDAWERAWSIQLLTATEDRALRASSLDEVLSTCVDLRAFPVGRPADFVAARGARTWFAVQLELNPVSADTIHRLRRWLSRPDGATSASDAFFGSFVSLFVNRRIGEAERTFAFRGEGEALVP